MLIGAARANGIRRDDRRPGEIADRVVEEAERVHLLPASRLHRLAIREQVAPQRQDHREHVLGNAVRRVITHVAHADAETARRLEIDVVRLRPESLDQPQILARPDDIGGQAAESSRLSAAS